MDASPHSLVSLADRVARAQSLSVEQTEWFFGQLMEGAVEPLLVAAVLTAMRVRGETVDELVGAATAMRAKMARPPMQLPGVLDTCGTGGDGVGTFNISTAAAIVVSACGVPVAKHGNRSVSSRTGSADVLESLGVNTAASPTAVARCVQEVGLGFFFAPQWHPAMKHAMPIRKALHFRTIFNLLGPLCNPAGAQFQLIGVGDVAWTGKLAEALGRLGTRAATVVSGSDGLDEVTLGGVTHAALMREGVVTMLAWEPADFGLPAHSSDNLKVADAAESAAVIRGVLEGRPGPARDIVLANSAAALWTAGRAADLKAGVATAAQAIDTGKAQQSLDKLIACSHAQ